MQDLKPTRMKCTLKLLGNFIQEFFDQNPISLLGLIALRNKRAELITELQSNSRKHIKSLEDMSKLALAGEPSLQNGFEIAFKSLKMVPTHASREILIVMGSLTTCDPGDLFATIEELKVENIRVSCITLSAEIYACKVMCSETLGDFSAAIDDTHLLSQLMQHVDPPNIANKQVCALIKMGFPYDHQHHNPKGGSNNEEKYGASLAMCSCHINADQQDQQQTNNSGLSTQGYNCPQCLCKYCEIPVECSSCGLTLVSAPHLARSYHHLFPVEPFTEEPMQNATESCFSCQKVLKQDIDRFFFRCQFCKQLYCIDCDLYIHDVLHVCIGCSTSTTNVASSNSHRRNSNKK